MNRGMWRGWARKRDCAVYRHVAARKISESEHKSATGLQLRLCICIMWHRTVHRRGLVVRPASYSGGRGSRSWLCIDAVSTDDLPLKSRWSVRLPLVLTQERLRFVNCVCVFRKMFTISSYCSPFSNRRPVFIMEAHCVPCEVST